MLTIVLVPALMVLAGAALGLLYWRDLSAARVRIARNGSIISTPFGSQQYAVLGSGHPVLVIHGAGGGFDQAIDLTRAITAHGYRIVAPSRFGYLGSAMPDEPTVGKQSDVYAQLLDELGIDSCPVVAVSAGAWSALEFAIRYGDRCAAVVLFVPASSLPPGTANYGGALARTIFHSDLAAWTAAKLALLTPDLLTRAMLGTPPAIVRAASKDQRARIREILEHLLPISARSGGIHFDIATAAGAVAPPLERIRCPVLTLSAEDDAFGTAIRARAIANAVPHGRAEIFPNGGHALVGRHDEALARVVAFLEAVRAGEPASH